MGACFWLGLLSKFRQRIGSKNYKLVTFETHFYRKLLDNFNNTILGNHNKHFHLQSFIIIKKSQYSLFKVNLLNSYKKLF